MPMAADTNCFRSKVQPWQIECSYERRGWSDPSRTFSIVAASYWGREWFGAMP